MADPEFATAPCFRDLSAYEIKISEMYFKVADAGKKLSLAQFASLAEREFGCEVSRQKVHRALKAVEKRAGIDLFEKAAGSALRLSNDKGAIAFTQEFRRAANRIDSGYADLESLACNAALLPELRIGIYPSMLRYLGPVLVKQMSEHCPRFKLQFEHGSTISFLQALSAGELDYAIGVSGETNLRATPAIGPRVVEEPLAICWSKMGITFLYVKGNRQRYSALWEVMKSSSVAPDVLAEHLLRETLCTVEQPRSDDLTEIASCTLSGYFAEGMPIDATHERRLVVVKTYRQARIIARAGSAVAVGPAPANLLKNASRSVKLKGACVGYDTGHEDSPLAFIPASHLKQPSAVPQPISGRPYAAFYLQDGWKHTDDKKSVALKILHETVTGICRKKSQLSGGLRYVKNSRGGIMLEDNLVD